MATGFGAGYYADTARIPADKTGVRTHITLLLPYGIPGLRGEYNIRTEDGTWRVFMNTWYVPPQALAAQLEETEVLVDSDGWIAEFIIRGNRHTRPKRKAVSLEPDRWGRSWRSEALLEFDGFLDPGAIDDAYDQRGLKILGPCCVCLNRLLDAVAYAGGRNDLSLLSTDDFFALKTVYLLNGTAVGSFTMAGRHIIWWRGPTPLDEEKQAVVKRVLSEDTSLALEDELLVTAGRKLAQGDARGCIIDAICAVETVIAPLLESAILARGVSRGKLATLIGPGGLGLSDQFYVLIPLLFAPGSIPEGLRTQFAQANSKRNAVVHRGDYANAQEAARHLETCSELVKSIKSLR